MKGKEQTRSSSCFPGNTIPEQTVCLYTQSKERQIGDQKIETDELTNQENKKINSVSCVINEEVNQQKTYRNERKKKSEKQNPN